MQSLVVLASTGSKCIKNKQINFPWMSLTGLNYFSNRFCSQFTVLQICMNTHLYLLDVCSQCFRFKLTEKTNNDIGSLMIENQILYFLTSDIVIYLYIKFIFSDILFAINNIYTYKPPIACQFLSWFACFFVPFFLCCLWFSKHNLLNMYIVGDEWI